MTEIGKFAKSRQRRAKEEFEDLEARVNDIGQNVARLLEVSTKPLRW